MFTDFPEKHQKISKKKDNYSPDLILKTEFELMMAALENPKMDILGHPFGMSLKRFGLRPNDSMFNDVINMCAKKNKIFEINCRYHPNPKYLINQCIKKDSKISLGSNAHSKDELGRIIEKIKSWKK